MDNENVKKEWKKAGSDLGHAFAGLGKMLIRTAKVGMEKADEWANSDDSPKGGKSPRAGIIPHKNMPGDPAWRDRQFSVYFDSYSDSACGGSSRIPQTAEFPR